MACVGRQQPSRGLTYGRERIAWEDANTVLFTAVYEDNRSQVVRCTLAGACERVGPPDIPAWDRRGFLVATRRSN